MRSFQLLAALGLAMTFTPGVRAEFTTVVGFDQQIFPSYVIATASIRKNADDIKPEHLGDPQGLLGVRITSPAADTPIKVTVECDDFLRPSVFSGVLAESDVEYEITPSIKYDYAKLATYRQSTPTSVVFRVQLGDELEEEQTVVCTVHSVNDCPFMIRHGEEIVDISFSFAAYVNEQHPFVDKLLREALDRGVVKAFTGYQQGEAQALLQAYAIWDLLVGRDMRYSSITNTASSSDNVACQHVRLLEDSINNSQANCVDGSVLWVSLLRKIGIDAFLVIEPTHCYAGFYTDAEHKHVYAIETTMLGAEIGPTDVQAAAEVDAAVPEALRQASYYSFAAALDVAGKSLSKHTAEEQTEDSGMRIIDIAAARRLGILPIAFQDREEFTQYDHSGGPASEVSSDASWDEEDMEDGTGDSAEEEGEIQENGVTEVEYLEGYSTELQTREVQFSQSGEALDADEEQEDEDEDASLEEDDVVEYEESSAFEEDE